LSKIGESIKTELIGYILEKSQTMDTSKMMKAAGMLPEVEYDNITEHLNIPYMNHEENALALDIFKPVVADDVELPVIVTIHGGGLTMGDRSLSRPVGRLLASKGYLVFSIEYRLAPRANVSQQLDDVCAGLDIVGKKLVLHNVDFTRIFLCAESAGAYLAAYVAAMNGSEKLQKAIGHRATRVKFKALGLNCGMFYTNANDPCGWLLSDQLYGDKAADERFMQYMNPEDPEIINNLPPTFLFTSRGDFLNDYSFRMYDALKKAGKKTKLLYYSTYTLSHAYFSMQTENPKTKESIDKMLEWIENAAKEEALEKEKTPEELAKIEKLHKRTNDGSICKQAVWKCIKENILAEEEKLKAVAVIDCTRQYTYEQMFNEWDRYAKVFTALGMTGSNKSRVAIAGAIAAEPLFAFYGLNMTGATASMMSYPDFLPGGDWKNSFKKEKITDLIITDAMVTPALWKELEATKEELGLKNILLLHSKMGGPTVGPAELIFNEFNYTALRKIPETVFLNELLSKYEDTEIEIGRYSAKHLAIITHTSGSTHGIRKPLPFYDNAVNSVACRFKPAIHQLGKGEGANKSFRQLISFDYSSFLNFSLANSTISNGETVILTYFGFIHPKFIRAIDYYDADVVFTAGFMLDNWIERRDIDDIRFDSLNVFACGGSYISPEKLKKYNEFVKKHGFTREITRGYGMSETGGAQLFVPEGCNDDILGYPDPVEDFLVYDEKKKKYYTAKDHGHTGVMYVASDSRCCNELDGVQLFEFTEIDGRNFVCTNDMVYINEDGSFSYVGRADKYFVNNDGVKFESGIVEKQMSSQPEVSQCAIVPVLDKRINDTVPVLYVIPEDKSEGAPDSICKALKKVFIEDKLYAKSNLPSQFIIVDYIPVTPTGKIDIFKITRERLDGKAYNIIPHIEDKKLIDITLEVAEQLSSNVGGTLPEGMGTGSALGIFEVFNSYGTQPTVKEKLQEAGHEKLSELMGKAMESETVMGIYSKLSGGLYKRRDYDIDIEK